MYRMERALEPCRSAWRFRAITSCRRRKTLQFRGNVTICTNKGFSYDYLSIADGKAIPYGIYDLVQNSGLVNVEIDHETAEIAVASMRRCRKGGGAHYIPLMGSG